jgi:hypothetical protein
MRTSALAVASDLVRFVAEDFDMRWSPTIEAKLAEIGLDLADARNALATCEVLGTTKEDAESATFKAVGTTTEGVALSVEVLIWSNRPVYHLLDVSLLAE